MSRYFQNQRANIADAESFMYQPPWELAQQSLAINQQGIDQGLATAQLFNNIDVNYIDDPREREIVENAQKYYNERAGEITNAISEDPMSWRKQNLALQNLSNEFKADMTTGELGKVQGSYNSLQNWMQTNKEMKTKNPSLYQTGLNHFLNEWRKNENRSLDAQFTGFNLTNAPDITSEKYRKIFEDVKADFTQGLDGRYMRGSEIVSEQEMQQIAYGLLMQDPEVQSYIKQQNIFGDKAFVDVDAEGNVTSKNLYSFYDSATGEKISQDEAKKREDSWKALSPEQKRLAQTPGYSVGLNREHGFYNGINSISKAYSYTKNTFDADKFALQNNQGVITRQNQNNQGRINKELKAIDFENDKAIMDYADKIAKGKEKRKFDRDLEMEMLVNTDPAVQANLENYFTKLNSQATVGADSFPSYDTDLMHLYASEGTPRAINERNIVTAETLKDLNKTPAKDSYSKDFYSFIADYKTKNPKADKTEIIDAYVKKNPGMVSARQKNSPGGGVGIIGDLTSYIAETISGQPLKPAIEKSIEHLEKSFDKYSNVETKKLQKLQEENATTQVSFVPLTPQGERAMKSVFETGKNGYYMVKPDGSRVQGKDMPAIKSFKQIGSNNPNETISAVVELEDNSLGYVYPVDSRSNGAYTNAILSVASNNTYTAGDNTALIESMTNRGVSQFTQAFMDVPYTEGKRSIPLNLGEGVQATIWETEGAQTGRYRVDVPVGNGEIRSMNYDNMFLLVNALNGTR